MEVILDAKQVNDIVSRLNNFGKEASSNSILLQIAVGVKDNILLKTAMGIDYKGNNFEPYSKAYAKREGKRNAWMYQTGVMLNSMTQKVIDNMSVMIYFNNATARERARWHNIEGAGKSKVKREFFGFSEMAKQEAFLKYSQSVLKLKAKYKL